MHRLLLNCRRILFISLFLLLFAADARSEVTSLLLTGDSGDYISGGQTSYFTPADGTFSAGQLYVPAAARADSATAGTSVRPESTTRAGAAGEGP